MAVKFEFYLTAMESEEVVPLHPITFIPPDLSKIPIDIQDPSTKKRISPDAVAPETKLKAALIGDTEGPAAARHYISLSLGFSVAAGTIDRWIKRLRDFKKEKPNTTPTVLLFSPRKRGAPSLLGPVLDASLLFFLTQARDAGSCVNAAIVIAVALGMLLHNNPSSLYQFGGNVKLSSDWAKKWLKRRGWVKRKATTGHRHPPDDYQQQKDAFLRRVNNTILTHNIPSHLVINFDQTGLSLLPTSNYTMAPRGQDQVAIAHKGDKRQITAVLAGSIAGDFLPPQLLYQGIAHTLFVIFVYIVYNIFTHTKGKTENCHPKGRTPPPNWHIHHSESHWSTADTNIKYIINIIIPFLLKIKTKLNLPHNYPSLLIFDVYKAQLDKAFLDTLSAYGIFYIFIPAGLTDLLQPMDLNVNKNFKHHYKQQFIQWYGLQIYRRIMRGEQGQNIVVKVPMSLIKPVSFDWIIAAFNSILPITVQKAFQMANISDVYRDVNNQPQLYPCNPSIFIQPVPPQNIISLRRIPNATQQQITYTPNTNSHLLNIPAPQLALFTPSFPISFVRYVENQ